MAKNTHVLNRLVPNILDLHFPYIFPVCPDEASSTGGKHSVFFDELKIDAAAAPNSLKKS